MTTTATLAAAWDTAMRAASTAAFNLLASVRPELTPTPSKGIWFNAEWDAGTHAGTIEIRGACDVDLQITALSVASVHRILAFSWRSYLDSHDPTATPPTGTHYFGDEITLTMGDDGTPSLELRERSLEGACALLAALSVPDTEPLDACLCRIPGRCISNHCPDACPCRVATDDSTTDQH